MFLGWLGFVTPSSANQRGSQLRDSRHQIGLSACVGNISQLGIDVGESSCDGQHHQWVGGSRLYKKAGLPSHGEASKQHRNVVSSSVPASKLLPRVPALASLDDRVYLISPISPFSPKLVLVRASYHRNRKPTNRVSLTISAFTENTVKLVLIIRLSITAYHQSFTHFKFGLSFFSWL